VSIPHRDSGNRAGLHLIQAHQVGDLVPTLIHSFAGSHDREQIVVPLDSAKDSAQDMSAPLSLGQKEPRAPDDSLHLAGVRSLFRAVRHELDALSELCCGPPQVERD
jgi:hypothetical protein